jgi:hypothetical protein
VTSSAVIDDTLFQIGKKLIALKKEIKNWPSVERDKAQFFIDEYMVHAVNQLPAANCQ